MLLLWSITLCVRCYKLFICVFVLSSVLIIVVLAFCFCEPMWGGTELNWFLNATLILAGCLTLFKQDISDELIPFSDLKPHLNKCLLTLWQFHNKLYRYWKLNNCISCPHANRREEMYTLVTRLHIGQSLSHNSLFLHVMSYSLQNMFCLFVLTCSKLDLLTYQFWWLQPIFKLTVE